MILLNAPHFDKFCNMMILLNALHFDKFKTFFHQIMNFDIPISSFIGNTICYLIANPISPRIHRLMVIHTGNLPAFIARYLSVLDDFVDISEFSGIYGLIILQKQKNFRNLLKLKNLCKCETN